MQARNKWKMDNIKNKGMENLTGLTKALYLVPEAAKSVNERLSLRVAVNAG